MGSLAGPRAGYMVSLTLHTVWPTHVTLAMVVNSRQQEEMTAARKLVSEWRAGIGSFGHHPPIVVTDSQTRSVISDLFMWSGVVVESILRAITGSVQFLTVLYLC